MIKKMIAMALSVLCAFSMCMNCYAAAPPAESAGVHASYVEGASSPPKYTAVITDGKAQISTDGGEIISVSGSMTDGLKLVVMPIPETETEAFNWFESCIKNYGTNIFPFDLYFKDTAGNRVTSETTITVSVTTADKYSNPVACYLDTDGDVTVLGRTVSGKTVTFKTNHTSYYVIAEKASSDPGGGGIAYTYYTVTATAGEGGSISPSGSVSVREGLDKAFTITPKDGYVISDVTVDGVSVKDKIVSYTYTFENVQKSHTIKATFIKESKVNPDTGVENPFTDVKDTDWFFKDVMFVYDRGLMVGTSDTTFSPYSTTTRVMVATTIWRMEGKPTPSVANPFTDVESSKYYTDAVVWAKENSIVSGYSATSFGPNDPVTREQLAVFFYNYAKYKGYDTGITGSLDKFTDKGDVSDWAVDAMQWAVGYGLIQGKTDNTLDPKGNATRAEFAAMLHRFIEKNELVEGVTTTGQMGWIDPKRLGIPNTGDTASSAWPFVMFASLATCAILMYQYKRKDNSHGGAAGA